MSQILQIDTRFGNRQWISIGIVWLFHLSAMVGISIGFEDWFVPKTPINLTVISLLLLWSCNLQNLKLWAGFVTFFAGGMLVEIIGVHFGVPFGTYAYGENLGAKFLEVPWFIGINWAVLTLICGIIASYWAQSKWAKIILGAVLMVVLDFFLEQTAPIFDFWEFENNPAPIENYLAWFGISIIFHWIYQSLRLNGDAKLAHQLYLAQLVFFVWFYGFYNL